MHANGHLTSGNGLSVPQAVVQGGLRVPSSTVDTGDFVVTGGSLSITSTAGNSLYASTSTSYTGTILDGLVAAGETSSNVLTLTSGSTVLMQV